MPKKKDKKICAAKPEPMPQPNNVRAETYSHEPLRPDILADMAREEPIKRELADYSETITILRDQKNFTFREIAKWLYERGIETDHNAVYREYTRGMPPEVAHDEALADEATEVEERGH